MPKLAIGQRIVEFKGLKSERYGLVIGTGKFRRKEYPIARWYTPPWIGVESFTSAVLSEVATEWKAMEIACDHANGYIKGNLAYCPDCGKQWESWQRGYGKIRDKTNRKGA